ncbi:MAG: thiamine pyrophosphate-binding protein [Sphingomonadales bacterium]
MGEVIHMGGKTVAEALVDSLLLHGVSQVYCVPGESYLSVLDALYGARDKIQTVSCRFEPGAANMAAAHGRMTGQPGIAFVTRGPGATQASVGVHTAFQSSTPMLLFIGQVPTSHKGREAFQEVDYLDMFRGLAKGVMVIDDPVSASQMVAIAYQASLSGRPGPVVVVLPEDVLGMVHQGPMTDPLTILHHMASEDELNLTLKILSSAEQPLIIYGGPRSVFSNGPELRDFVEANQIPLAVSFRSQDYFDNRHPNYVGDLGFGKNPALAARVKEADVILALGTRLGEIATEGYTLLEAPKPKQKLIHVFPEATELGKVYKPDLAIRADAGAFARTLAGKTLSPSDRRREWCGTLRAEYEDWIVPRTNPGPVQLAEIFTWLNENLPEDAILANGAGNYTGWLHRYYQYRRPGTQLAPKSGAMGFGLPAAIAAKLARPDRTVVAVAGDGCFMMAVPELATAVQYGAAIIVMIINNSMYGTIRMYQERQFPGRVWGTDLQNPDFAALATSFGAVGVRIERTDAFAPAFEAALRANKPTVLDIIVDPEAISTQISLADLAGS